MVIKIIRKYSRGVTLVEILAVISILVLLAVLSLPALNIFRSQSAVKDAATTVQSMLREGRGMAIAQGKNVLVEIRGDDESAVLWDQTKTTPLTKRWYAPAAVDILDTNMLDMDKVKTVYFDILFKPNGSANRDVSIYLKRRDAEDTDESKYYTITVVNTTGVARIYPNKQ